MNDVPKDHATTTAERLVLAGICCWVAAVQLWGALHWNLAYDEGWHVFFAAVEPIQIALKAMVRDTHPPLPYLMLRPLVDIGYDAVWPRLLSVLPAIPQPILMWAIARRLGLDRRWALVGAALLGTSHVFTELGVSVRAYSLGSLGTLAALYHACAFLPGSTARPGPRTFLWFGLWSSLAVHSVYPAAFPTVALVGAVLLIAVPRREFFADALRRLREHSTWLGWLVLISGHASAFGFFVLTYADKTVPHVTEWFLEDGENPLEFFAYGATHLLRYFSPLNVEAGAIGTASVVATLLATAVAIGTMIRRRGPADASRGALHGAFVLAVLVQVGMLFVLGVLGSYPFGGWIRHQYTLLAPGVLALIVALDGIDRRLGSRPITVGLVLSTLALAAWTTQRSFRNDEVGEFPQSVVWQDEANIVFDSTATDTPIYMSTFPFIGLYGCHRQLGWTWREQFDEGGYHTYVVGSEPQSWTVYRDRHIWNIDPIPNARNVERVVALFDSKGMDELVLFVPRRIIAGLQGREIAGEPAVRAAWATGGLDLVERRIVGDNEVHRLRRSP